MRSVDNISQELFDKIRSRVSSIKLGDENGAVTTDPAQARFFEFNFKHRDLPIGAVTISLNEEGKLQVYFPNSMVEDADSGTADAWYGFLKELSRFSARNMLNYESHNVTKERLDKKDYQFLTQRNQDEVMENRLHGTSQKSFLETGTAKLIIKHKGTVDETKMGARSRNISAIYIENSEGERFKFANNYLPGARAMARHVSNEGHTRDDRGIHIVEIMKEMTDLKTFVRSVKRDDYVNEDAQEVIDAATDRYYGLKDTLKAVSSAKGYNDYFENWAPGAVEVEENDLEDLKQKLTREVYDDRLTDSLASVRRAMDYKANMEAKDDLKLSGGKGRDEEEMDTPIKPYFDRSIDPAEKSNLDDKADSNTASSEQALAAIVNSDDDIVVYDNPSKQEVENYLQMMKNSDMPVDKKNQNMIVNIIEYLANNMVDDNAARALSNLDLGSPEGRKTGMQLAVKYLKGKVELQAPKAKKDIKGKDKNEGTTFEAYAQRMDMVAEGTWALPENEADAMKIAAMMANPITLGDGGDDATNAIGGLIGDDELYDDLGEAGDNNPEGDARGIIIGWMMEHVDDYGDPYKETLQVALDKIRADGNDMDITIPRTFSAQQDRGMTKKQADAAYNTSSTQGERMGSNADDMKEDPNEGNEFSGALAQAKKDGKDEFEVDGKVYKVSEAEIEEGRMSDIHQDAQENDREDFIKMHTSTFGSAEAAGKAWDDVQDDLDEGRMSDLSQEIDEVAAEMEQNDMLAPFVDDFITMAKKTYNIKAALEKVIPDYVPGNMIQDLVGETVEEVEVDEAADMIAKMKEMAGVGSGVRSNHGIHEGEAGYQLTPRSIVAREMRKLQDIERGS